MGEMMSIALPTGQIVRFFSSLLLSAAFLQLSLYGDDRGLQEKRGGQAVFTVQESRYPGNTFSQEKAVMQKLTHILAKTAEYCEKLTDLSLHYFCEENIREIIYPLPIRYRPFATSDMGIHGEWTKFINGSAIINTYMYDYQLIRNRKRVKEKRILLAQNGEQKFKKNARLRTKIFDYKTVVYYPLIFKKEEQRFYRFKIVCQELFGDKPAWVIRVMPGSGIVRRDTWGEFWVSKKDYSILRIKIYQESLGHYYRIIRKAKCLRARPRITIVADYEVKRNSIRLPSHFFMEESYIKPGSKSLILSSIDVTYSSYRYFGVDVKILEKPL